MWAEPTGFSYCKAPAMSKMMGNCKKSCIAVSGVYSPPIRPVMGLWFTPSIVVLMPSRVRIDVRESKQQFLTSADRPAGIFVSSSWSMYPRNREITLGVPLKFAIYPLTYRNGRSIIRVPAGYAPLPNSPAAFVKSSIWQLERVVPTLSCAYTPPASAHAST